jgi:ABC-type antimicrobial peptide transport system permease subunit
LLEENSSFRLQLRKLDRPGLRSRGAPGLDRARLSVPGLLPAAVGLHGVMAYTVTRRTPEIGVRMAMGAEKRDVIRMVLAGAAKLAGVGSALGLLGAVFVTRPLAMFLVCGPERRAAAVDPMTALREE